MSRVVRKGRKADKQRGPNTSLYGCHLESGRQTETNGFVKQCAPVLDGGANVVIGKCTPRVQVAEALHVDVLQNHKRAEYSKVICGEEESKKEGEKSELRS